MVYEEYSEYLSYNILIHRRCGPAIFIAISYLSRNLQTFYISNDMPCSKGLVVGGMGFVMVL
jgi:hypothetical protein